jgi:hypothetical protein
LWFPEGAAQGAQNEWFAAGRSAVIENFGVRVLRFPNAEVCYDMDSLFDADSRGVASTLRLKAGPLTPAPLLVGEGSRPYLLFRLIR